MYFRFGLSVKEGLVISFPVYSDVFCLHLNDDLVAFGCKGKNTIFFILFKSIFFLLGLLYLTPEFYSILTRDLGPPNN
jgi:hypothetical protein